MPEKISAPSSSPSIWVKSPFFIGMLSLGALFSVFAQASVSPGESSLKIHQKFTEACKKAFQSSAGGKPGDNKDAETAAHDICTCTAKEADHEKMPLSALARQTEEIAKDPKFKIQDQKLLNAFHWCTIQAMEAAEHQPESK